MSGVDEYILMSIEEFRVILDQCLDNKQFVAVNASLSLLHNPQDSGESGYAAISFVTTDGDHIREIPRCAMLVNRSLGVALGTDDPELANLIDKNFSGDLVVDEYGNLVESDTLVFEDMLDFES